MKHFVGSEAVEVGGNRLAEAAVGKEWRIWGLTSARGLELNGKIGVCEGFDPMPNVRLHLRVPGYHAPFKVKMNCCLEQDWPIPDEPDSVSALDLSSQVDRNAILLAANARISRKTVREEIRSNMDADRTDMSHRATKLSAYLDALEQGSTAPPVFGCGEVGDAGLSDPFVRNMMQMKPPCLGNSKLNLNDLYLGGVDCVQAGRRLAEYPLSGFCVPCQIQFMESQGM